MDKISGIIPSSARVTNVDLKDAPASRAANPGIMNGAGAVGRLSESIPGSVGWKSREARQAAVASQVSDSFFMKPKPEVETPASSKEQPQAQAEQPEGLFPKGSFIDRNA